MDRYVVSQYAQVLFPDAAYVVCLSSEGFSDLTSSVDEIAALHDRDNDRAWYFRLQEGLSAMLGVLAPRVRMATDSLPVPTPRRRHAVTRPATWPEFRPVGPEALAAEMLLRNNIGRRWTLALLCQQVHLSSKQLLRIFKDAYGKTPHGYLVSLRVEEMARLLRDTDLPVPRVGSQVGWHSRGQASEVFQRAVGITPAKYRRIGPPSAGQPQA